MHREYNFCYICGSKQAPEDMYCASCSTQRRETFPETSEYVCSGCGSPLLSHDKYCCQCGYRSNIPETITPQPKPIEPGLWGRFAQRHPNFTQILEYIFMWISLPFRLILYE